MSNIEDESEHVASTEHLQPASATLPGKNLLPGGLLGFSNEPFGETGFGR